MTDIFGIILNATCTGIGVALGNEIYQHFKKKTKEKKLLKGLGILKDEQE